MKQITRGCGEIQQTTPPITQQGRLAQRDGPFKNSSFTGLRGEKKFTPNWI
jgi:hypothetical protein